jgi:hypothetical protein
MTLVLPAMIAAIVSILFGSVAAAVVSHALGAARGDKEYRLKKLEELFVSIECACRNLIIHYHYLWNVTDPVMTWAEAWRREIHL